MNVEKFKLMEQYHQYNQSFLHLKNTFNEEKKVERDRKIEQEMLGNFYTFKTLSGHEHWRGQLLLNKQDQTSNRYDSILQWLWTENGSLTDSLSYPKSRLERLSHLKNYCAISN